MFVLGGGQSLFNNGFTLIELLAVTIILAIIALIAVPIILNIIDETKKSAFKETVKGVERGIEISSTKEKVESEIEYKYEKGSWGENKIQIDGSIPKYVEVKVNKDGKIRYAITDGKYCIIKEYDGKESIKKIGNKNTDNVIQEKYCELDAVIGTSDDCFEFDSSTGTITKYYTHEKNNSKNKICSKDVIIPNKIDGVAVKIIDRYSFYNLKLINIMIPDTVININQGAFKSNNLTNLIIPEGVENLGAEAFQDNQLENLSLPSTITTISWDSFKNNKLPQDQAYIYKRNKDGSIDYTTIIGYGGKLKDINIPSEKNGIKLKSIGYKAFRNNSLTSVIIPDGILDIGDFSFSKNNLSGMMFPSSVINIGKNSFEDNPLTYIIIKNQSDKVTLGTSVFGTFDINNIKWESTE